MCKDYKSGFANGKLHSELNLYWRLESERKAVSGSKDEMPHIRQYWTGYLDGMSYNQGAPR